MFFFLIVLKVFYWFWNASDISHYEIASFNSTHYELDASRIGALLSMLFASTQLMDKALSDN